MCAIACIELGFRVAVVFLERLGLLSMFRPRQPFLGGEMISWTSRSLISRYRFLNSILLRIRLQLRCITSQLQSTQLSSTESTPFQLRLLCSLAATSESFLNLQLLSLLWLPTLILVLVLALALKSRRMSYLRDLRRLFLLARNVSRSHRLLNLRSRPPSSD